MMTSSFRQFYGARRFGDESKRSRLNQRSIDRRARSALRGPERPSMDSPPAVRNHPIGLYDRSIVDSCRRMSVHRPMNFARSSPARILFGALLFAHTASAQIPDAALAP